MKLLKKIACTLLTAILFNASIATPVLAAEQTDVVELEATITTYDLSSFEGIESRSTTFTNTAIDIRFESDGMHIVIHTGTSMTASVIGVKDIEIQKKGIFGIWSTVATSTGGEAYNISNCAASLTYTGAVEGETYRVTCTHYADVDGYRELYHETEGLTCAY